MFNKKYKIIDFKWGYIITSFDTLKDAVNYLKGRGMRYERKKGSMNIYAAR
jgi:hypothetical protein